ncbi:hypothetical protein INR49_012877, partial [Caranx melampygus]
MEEVYDICQDPGVLDGGRSADMARLTACSSHYSPLCPLPPIDCDNTAWQGCQCHVISYFCLTTRTTRATSHQDPQCLTAQSFDIGDDRCLWGGGEGGGGGGGGDAALSISAIPLLFQTQSTESVTLDAEQTLDVVQHSATRTGGRTWGMVGNEIQRDQGLDCGNLPCL